MPPRRSFRHPGNQVKWRQTIMLTSNSLILQIEPAFPQRMGGIQLLQIKVCILILDGNVDATNIIHRIGSLHTKEMPPEPPMGMNPQETLITLCAISHWE